MTQYIITEEELNDLAMYEDSEHEGRYAPICDLARSRPYKSERNMNPICGSAECLKIIKPHENKVARVERDKVLDELREKYVEFLNHPCPELADKYKHCCDVDWCGLCTLDEVLAELRAGEP